MMIDYESKVSKILSIIKFIIPFPAVVFIIIYWVNNNELFLTLVFACVTLFFLCDSSANLIEIKHCLRKEEKKALKLLGIGSLVLGVLFLLVFIGRFI
jgi:uncharacterized membrane protein